MNVAVIVMGPRVLTPLTIGCLRNREARLSSPRIEIQQGLTTSHTDRTPHVQRTRQALLGRPRRGERWSP